MDKQKHSKEVLEFVSKFPEEKRRHILCSYKSHKNIENDIVKCKARAAIFDNNSISKVLIEQEIDHIIGQQKIDKKKVEEYNYLFSANEALQMKYDGLMSKMKSSKTELTRKILQEECKNVDFIRGYLACLDDLLEYELPKKEVRW